MMMSEKWAVVSVWIPTTTFTGGPDTVDYQLVQYAPAGYVNPWECPGASGYMRFVRDATPDEVAADEAQEVPA